MLRNVWWAHSMWLNRKVLTALLAVSVYATRLCAQSQSESANIDDLFDVVSMISDIRSKSENARQTLDAADQLLNAKKSNVPKIEIGEFETDKDFAQRKKDSLEKWSKELAKQQLILLAAKQVYSETEEKRHLAEGLKFPATATLKLVNSVLPRFNREGMCFDGLTTKADVAERQNNKNGALLRTTSIFGNYKMRCTSLSVAQDLKEGIEAGSYLIRWKLEGGLDTVESPIITREEQLVTRTSPAALGILGAALAAKLLGASDDNIAPLASVPVTETIRIPAESKPGVRYHVTFHAISGEVIDSKGSAIPGITIDIQKAAKKSDPKP